MSGIESNSSGIFDVTGELSFTTVPTLNHLGQKIIASNKLIKFSLNKVTSSDNAGVALLASWARYAKKHGKEIIFLNPPKQLFDIIKMCGLQDILPIKQD